MLSALKVDAAERETLVKLSVAHSHALRSQLRATWHIGRGHGRTCCSSDPDDGNANGDRDAQLDQEQVAAVKGLTNPADRILGLAAERVGALHRQDQLDSYSAVAITKLLDQMGAVQGACERIATTPLPFPYQLLVHRTAYMYICLAPFAMAEEMGWWTPLFNSIVAYTFFGLDELARQLEQPFGLEPQCLALNAVCRTIEVSASEAMDTMSPAPLMPGPKYVLL